MGRAAQESVFSCAAAHALNPACGCPKYSLCSTTCTLLLPGVSRTAKQARTTPLRPCSRRGCGFMAGSFGRCASPADGRKPPSLKQDARGGWAISLWGRSAYVPRPRHMSPVHGWPAPAKGNFLENPRQISVSRGYSSCVLEPDRPNLVIEVSPGHSVSSTIILKAGHRVGTYLTVPRE